MKSISLGKAQFIAKAIIDFEALTPHIFQSNPPAKATA